MRVLNDRIAVEMDQAPDKSDGGILLPDTAKQEVMRGTVRFVGPGLLIDGRVITLDVTEGEKVYLMKYAGSEIDLNGVKLRIVREDDILAVV